MVQLGRTKVDLLGVAVSLEGLGDTKNGLMVSYWGSSGVVTALTS